MQTAIIIPARYQSSRFPGKPLALIKGRPAIHWTYETALTMADKSAVFVATDDERIADAVRSIGGQVLMTSEDCRNGTERVAEAAVLLEQQAGVSADIIVNLQGDAPLVPKWFVSPLIDYLIKATAEIGMVTPVLRCETAHYEQLIQDRKEGRVGATTAVFGHSGQALYFSKEVIPFLPADKTPDDIPIYHHVGVYAYRPGALAAYPSWPIGPLEQAEQLEQLRFLEAGESVHVVEVESHGHQFWELNNPEDIALIERYMASNAQLNHQGH